MDKSVIQIFEKIRANPDIFFQRNCTAQLANLAASPDLHLLFTGITGCGKLSNIIYLLKYNPFCNGKSYDLATFKPYNNKPTHSDEILLNKILYCDNIFFIDFQIITSSELGVYFDFITSLSETTNLDGRKKIIIGRHITDLPLIFQKRLGDAMEKSVVIFWLTASNTSLLNKKIAASCALIRVTPFQYDDFIKIEYWRLNKIHRKAQAIAVKAMYSVYVNNNYNWGYTLAQIKWSLEQMLAGKSVEIETIPIQNKIVLPLIKKYGKLTSIVKLEDIRTHLSGLISLDISPQMILTIATQHYLSSKMNNNLKAQIVELAASSSRNLAQTEKHLVILENFFYNVINLYFST